MICNKCGQQVNDGLTFCPHCGNPMQAGNTAGNQQYQQQYNQQYNQQAGAYQQQGYAGQQGYYSPVEKLQVDRSLISYILFTILTCGIYSYYFIYKMAHDVNIACEGDGESTSGLAAFIVLSIITCGIYALIWEYKLGNRLAMNAPRYGMAFQENGTTVLMWYIFGILLCGIGPYFAMHILIKNSNAICAAYNQTHGFY